MYRIYLLIQRDKLANLTHLKSHSRKTQLFFWGGGDGRGGEWGPFQEAYMTLFNLLLTRDFKPWAPILQKQMASQIRSSVGRHLSSAFTHHYENVTSVTSLKHTHRHTHAHTKQNRVPKESRWFGKHVLQLRAFSTLPLSSLTRKMFVYIGWVL